MSDSWNKKRGRSREESYHRDGVWTREFHARCEPWPVLEQWANDRDFHLVGMRGKRRLYQKGDNASWYQVMLDIREREEGRGMVLQAWIQAGWLARLAHLFFHGKVLRIEPSGWAGVWKRREACADFNELLTRFRQLPIVGSETWHIADVDPSTLGLLASFLLPLLGFVIFDGSKLEVGPALSNALLVTLWHRLTPLLWVVPALAALHHFIAVKRFQTWLAKGISMGTSFLLFTVLSLVLMTRSASEMAAQKVSYHCLYRFDDKACREALVALPPKERSSIGVHLPQLFQELTRIDSPAPPRTR